MVRKFQRIFPNELVSGHLFYSEKVAKVLAGKQTVHYFIYRDPRDVVVSEAHYLTQMNKWHRLHNYFKQLPNESSRIMFSITGTKNSEFPYDYPDIAKRFERYKPWIKHPHVLSLKFEELVGQKAEETVEKIIRFYLEKAD